MGTCFVPAEEAWPSRGCAVGTGADAHGCHQGMVRSLGLQTHGDLLQLPPSEPQTTSVSSCHSLRHRPLHQGVDAGSRPHSWAPHGTAAQVHAQGPRKRGQRSARLALCRAPSACPKALSSPSERSSSGRVTVQTAGHHADRRPVTMQTDGRSPRSGRVTNTWHR